MPTKIDTLLTPPPSRTRASRLGVRGEPPWRAIAAVVVAVALVGAGAAGYLIGNAPEADLDAVRSDAAAEGRQAGIERGSDEGYREAFRAARTRRYVAAYRSAYRDAYAAEFESAGLDVPERIRVPSQR